VGLIELNQLQWFTTVDWA